METVFAGSGLANDTLVISSGDTIHPLGETVIKIERENLLISYNKATRLWDVEVDFIFYNPTNQAIKEEVAFVNESVPYEKFNHKIEGFTTRVNGITIPFSRKDEKRFTVLA
ncbi:MAG TPA: hypothetical protein GXZ26_08055 [Firmicutes bacterium]|nr:hypothetical protein [Bacillota bacterium]